MPLEKAIRADRKQDEDIGRWTVEAVMTEHEKNTFQLLCFRGRKLGK